MNNLRDVELDNAFNTLIALLSELNETDFSLYISEIYEELLTNPSRKRVAILRSYLRRKLAARPGGIGDMYFETDGTKNRKLLHSAGVIRSFARVHVGDLLYQQLIR